MLAASVLLWLVNDGSLCPDSRCAFKSKGNLSGALQSVSLRGLADNMLYPQFRPFRFDDASNFVCMKLDRGTEAFQTVDEYRNDFPPELSTQKEGKLRNILRIERRMCEHYRQMRVRGQ